MQRRSYLRGSLAGAGLVAGCLALPDGGSTPTPRPTARIVDRDPQPDLPVEPAIEVAEPSASDAGAPELRATVTNTATYPVEVGEERGIVFAYVTAEGRPGLQLVPVSDGVEPVEPGCWRLAEPIVIAEYYGVVSLASGEAVERRLGVWGAPDATGCLPSGEFRFRTSYAGARDRTEGLDDQEWSGTWGFVLALE